ncbi:hypothetical protein EDC04DRAFT_2740604 [Pisolithus marmoratus]|nr:hypothetical protein EDC04DRAFT_2740604 [Pisolithus marmoratus]
MIVALVSLPKAHTCGSFLFLTIRLVTIAELAAAVDRRLGNGMHQPSMPCRRCGLGTKSAERMNITHYPLHEPAESFGGLECSEGGAIIVNISTVPAPDEATT